MEIFLSLIFVLVTLLIILFKYMQTYWRRRGISHDEPDFPAGNMKGWRTEKHLSEVLNPVYEHHKGTGPFAGFYFYMKPAVMALDLDFIKNILIKDFNYFVNRGVFHNERDDPLSGHLFAIEDEKWRILRNKLSPTFTSGKMKFMFPTVLKVAEELSIVMDEKQIATSDGIVEVTNLVSRYTADSIGSCAFGIECNSLRNPEAEFVVMGKKAIIERRHNYIIDSYLLEAFPDLARKLRLRQVHQDCHDFYMRIVREAVEHRTKNGIKRKDFMDLLLNISELNGEGGDGKSFTLNEIAAQSFIFFVAGFDTSSTTMGFALYELAKNQDIQSKAKMEIERCLSEHNGELTYECMNDMKFLHQIIAETLRKYPVVVNLVRKANAHYIPSDPKYYIEKGTTVMIPVYAIQHDPDIYPEPSRFDPNRFTDEEIQKRHSCSYLPFGEGPRNCIGLRFGKMQTVLGLALLLHNFKFSFCEKTEPPRFKKDNILTQAENGIYLRVEKMKENTIRSTIPS